MKYVIVSIILVLTFHKEIIDFLKRVRNLNKTVSPATPENEVASSIVLVEPQVSSDYSALKPELHLLKDEPLLSYEDMKQGYIRIIKTTYGSGKKQVRLNSYVYDGNIVRRVVVNSSRERVHFGTLKCDDLNNEGQAFKQAYVQHLNPTQSVSEVKAQIQPKTKTKAKPIPTGEVKKTLLSSFTGKIVSFGFAPYNGDENSPTFTVDIMTENGLEKLHGVNLERALKDANIGSGDKVTLSKYSPIEVIDGDSGRKTSKAKIWTAVKEA